MGKERNCVHKDTFKAFVLGILLGIGSFNEHDIFERLTFFQKWEEPSGPTHPPYPKPPPIPTPKKEREKRPVLAHQKLGIRIDWAEYMHWAKDLGASKVRIAGNNKHPIEPGITKALRASQEENLRVLYVFNPSTPLTREEIRSRLEYLLGNFQIEALEIGNEPDNSEFEFWQDRDFKSFADFVKTTIEEARSIKPDVTLILGAFVQAEHFQTAHQDLQSVGADLAGVRFAVHAYNTVSDLEHRLGVIREKTSSPIVISELGVQSHDKRALLRMLDFAMDQPDVESVYIHELLNFQELGLIDPSINNTLPDKPNQGFYLVQNWAKEGQR